MADGEKLTETLDTRTPLRDHEMRRAMLHLRNLCELHAKCRREVTEAALRRPLGMPTL